MSRHPSLHWILDEILYTAIELLKADKGDIQFYDEHENNLKLVAQKGFTKQFVEHFKIVIPGYCVCGRALKRHERVIVEDVFKDPLFSYLGPIFSSYGFVAVQSTPLLREDGTVLGMISTHFAQPHRPEERELKLFDQYIRQAERAIENELKKRQP